MKVLLESYFFPNKSEVKFDYSCIRPEGVYLKGFGGISSGPKPLRELHEGVQKVLETGCGKLITTRLIVDVMNMVGKCVVSGNIRRTAEIVFGDAKDEEFLNLKNYEVNPERADW